MSCEMRLYRLTALRNCRRDCHSAAHCWCWCCGVVVAAVAAVVQPGLCFSGEFLQRFVRVARVYAISKIREQELTIRKSNLNSAFNLKLNKENFQNWGRNSLSWCMIRNPLHCNEQRWEICASQFFQLIFKFRFKRITHKLHVLDSAVAVCACSLFPAVSAQNDFFFFLKKATVQAYTLHRPWPNELFSLPCVHATVPMRAKKKKSKNVALPSGHGNLKGTGFASRIPIDKFGMFVLEPDGAEVSVGDEKGLITI